MNDRLQRHSAGGTSYLTGGEGPTVVFLHGIPGSALTWEPVAMRMQNRYRVILPDLRGFGHSEPPVEDYYLDGQARAVKDLLDALGVEAFSLVTHDFGGPVGLTAMRRFPDLGVQGLVLSDTNVFTDTHVPLPLRLAKVPLLGRLFFGAAVGNRFGLRLLYRAAVRQRGTATWQRFQRHLTPSGMAMTRRIFQRSLADLEGNYRGTERMLPEVGVPTLVLWGDADPFFSADVAERTRAAIPGADLVVYERTGHFVPEERPAEVTSDVLEFLQSW